jgi:hypothetical protein
MLDQNVGIITRICHNVVDICFLVWIYSTTISPFRLRIGEPNLKQVDCDGFQLSMPILFTLSCPLPI